MYFNFCKIFAYFLSRHYLIVMVVCILKKKNICHKILWNLNICFQFCNIKIQIFNVFILYTCNLILHAVKPARTGSGRTKNIFTRGIFASFCLHSLQFLLRYHLTSPVSPSPSHFGMACCS
jgi:hypothetical protein